MTFQNPNAGYYPAQTIINPNAPIMKPAVSTLNPDEEKLLQKGAASKWQFKPEDVAKARCNHQPGQNGEEVAIVDSDDGVKAVFHCRRCGTTWEIDHRLTKEDVKKVCDIMHNIINTVKLYGSDEIPRDYARECFSIDAVLPHCPDLYEHASNSIRRKLQAMNNQYSQVYPGYNYGQPNPYATAYNSGLTTPSATNMYNQYMQVTQPMFNGNGMPQQYYQYGGQPMMGAPVQYQQAPAFANPYQNVGYNGVTPVGGIMTGGDPNPLVANAAPNNNYSVPAPPSQQVMFGSFAPPSQQVPNPPVQTAQANVTQQTPQLTMPTANGAQQTPVPTPPATAPSAPVPAGNGASIAL